MIGGPRAPSTPLAKFVAFIETFEDSGVDSARFSAQVATRRTSTASLITQQFPFAGSVDMFSPISRIHWAAKFPNGARNFEPLFISVPKEPLCPDDQADDCSASSRPPR